MRKRIIPLILGLLGLGFGVVAAEAAPEFVAVGEAGTVLTSSDGLTWTSRTSGTTKRLRAVAYSNSLFTAVGEGGTILTSPDGVTWTGRASPSTESLRGVAASPTLLVAVGGSTGMTMLKSADGASWSDAGDVGQPLLRAIAWGNGLFVAVGTNGTILTTADTVTLLNRVSGTTDRLDGVVWTGTEFVVVSQTGKVLRSTDGITWTISQGYPPAWLEGLTWSDTSYVATGAGGRISTSADGITWSAATTGTSATIHGVTWSGARFTPTGNPAALVGNISPYFVIQPLAQAVAAGSTATFNSLFSALSATYQWLKNGLPISGATNATLVIPTVQVADGGIYSVQATSNGSTLTSAAALLGLGTPQFVAVGANGTVLTSLDSVTWTSHASGTTKRLRAVTGFVTPGVALYITVGETGTILTSPDAITWTSRASGTTQSLRGVAVNTGGFVAVGGTTSALILTSADGVNWSGLAPGAGALRAITWGNGLFVTVGANGTIMTSSDANNWISRTSGTTDRLDGAIWTGSEFVVVSQAGKILRSVDGINWAASQGYPPSWLEGLAWSDTRYVAVGAAGMISTSPDGATWSSATSGTSATIHGVIWTGPRLVARGDPVALLGDISPYFVIQPLSQLVAAGSTVTFHAVVSALNATYQWFKNAVAIPDGTGTTLIIGNVQVANAGIYTVQATSNGSTFISNAAMLSIIGQISAVGADFNGDGKEDILWENTITGAHSIWLMNGTSLASAVDPGTRTPDWRVAATADFNGDGQTDILWENTVTGDHQFWLMNGTTQTGTVDLGVIPTAWHVAAAADFNGDGKTDLLWENTFTGAHSIWLMNGTALASAVDPGAVPAGWRAAAAADFNGDGKADILWENTVTGDHLFWLMNGTVLAGTVELGVVAPAWHVAAVGDFNGDGKADLLWENSVTGDHTFWLMNGTTLASSVALGVIPTAWRVGTQALTAIQSSTVTTMPVVPVAPAITVQPSPLAAIAGQSISFTVAASGTPAPTYQWRFNSNPIGGATGATLMLVNVQPGDAGNYDVVVTNSAGAITSNVATLSVGVPPTITTQPQAVSAINGQSASFNVIAAGTATLTYQWSKGGAPIGGATSATLAFASLQVSDAGSYTVVVTNAFGTVSSNAATLAVGTGAPVIITQPRTVVGIIGQTATFTLAATGTPGPTYQWQRLPAGSGIWANLSDGGSYGGTSTVTLTVTGVTAGMLGDQFRCVITNTAGALTSNAASLAARAVGADFNGDGKEDILWENTITGAHSIWLMNGTSLASAVDPGTRTPDWRVAATADFNGDGQTDILWENTVTGDHQFWLMNGTTQTGTVDLGVIPTAWHVAAAADFNGDGKTDLLWENTFTGAHSIWLMNGTALASAVDPGAVPAGWRAAAAADFNGDGKADILWENTVTGDHLFWLMNGTVLAGTVELGVVAPAWHVAAVGDFNGDGKADLLWENSVTGDHTFWLMNGTTLASSVALGVIPTAWRVGTQALTAIQSSTVTTMPVVPVAPAITVQPSPLAAIAGQSISFTVAASGTPAPTYQWRFNSNPIGGATGATLMLVNVQPGDAGNYDVVVTNSAGAITSNVATLSVGVPPTITTQPQAAAVFIGQPASFTVVATGDPTLTYQWSKGGAPIGGATSATLSLANVQSSDGGSYTVAVTNAFGTATSNAATLLADTGAPAVTTQPNSVVGSVGQNATFTINLSGSPAPTCQWQRLPAGSTIWVNLTDGGNYSGTTTLSLTVAGVTAGMLGDQFRCIITNTVSSATSNAALLAGPSGGSDFNGDGKTDILWENTITGAHSIWLMNGTSLASAVDPGTRTPDWRVAATADFNGDGQTDILWENTVTGDHQFWLMNGTTVASTVTSNIVSSPWRVAAAADFNGDGKADILWENTATGVHVIWLMNGTTITSTVTIGLPGNGWRVAVAADFNGDGKADILWENTVTGEHLFWLMDGTNLARTVDLGVIPTAWFVAKAGDFDGDGKADLLWENSITGDHAFWLMNGTTFASSIDLGVIPTAWRVTK